LAGRTSSCFVVLLLLLGGSLSSCGYHYVYKIKAGLRPTTQESEQRTVTAEEIDEIVKAMSEVAMHFGLERSQRPWTIPGMDHIASFEAPYREQDWNSPSYGLRLEIWVPIDRTRIHIAIADWGRSGQSPGLELLRQDVLRATEAAIPQSDVQVERDINFLTP
jgi:hypothetical protein